MHIGNCPLSVRELTSRIVAGARLDVADVVLVDKGCCASEEA
ncbi:hypothetical protein [Cryptosporangium phraense]|nr:hypothetical protein [Cryptosporangium phraense]